jgi:predicted nucleic acid-binding protein
MPEVVSNTGPLIALASIGQFNLLQNLFGKVLIPPAVRAEVLDETTMKALSDSDWIAVRAVQDSLAVRLLQEELDAGESEAIVLARETNADLILLDERAATRKARSVGLPAIGTLGVLLAAKKQGLLIAIKQLLNELRIAGFHMSDRLYYQVLESACESRDDSFG